MWLVRTDAWITASVLVVIMLLAAEVGLRVGRRTADLRGAKVTRVDDASAALFGLLLAFTFGSATTRYDRRLWLMVNEATAIGDFAGAAGVLAEPQRSELRKDLVAYLDVRIATTLIGEDPVKEAQLLERTRDLQQSMHATAQRAVQSQNSPSVHTALLMTYNSTTTAFENRRAALYDRVPLTILVMLIVTSTFAAFSLGRVQGVNRARQPVAMVVFIALVGFSFYTTLDLEQPRSGLVRVPVAALQSVRASLVR
jgi:hypothetical protein